ncbi:hypothetical protein CQA53_06215 [Helicobacter didelphidarum]|uniref:Uncharacterized protein n=2 Tax=Helicobacter didelphidarum TaxID=2040648 RepID=A0A3D8IKB3_9HELI|nr:hypothetical protein CQA53_06215 [Helicobacter didelphidarum]
MRVAFGSAFSTHISFSFVNAFIGVCVIYLFFFLIFARFPITNFNDISILCFILFFLMSAVIKFGSIFYWAAGSFNYLWAYFLILSFLIPYRLFWEDYFNGNKSRLIQQNSIIKNGLHTFGIFFLGIFAGWCIEANIVLILVHIAFILYAIKKKVTLPLWYYMGVIGFIIGWIILYVSPGSAKRLMLFIESGDARTLSTFLALSIEEKIAILRRIYVANEIRFVILALCIILIISSNKIFINKFAKVVYIIFGILFIVLCIVLKLNLVLLIVGFTLCFVGSYYFRERDKRFSLLLLLIASFICLISLYIGTRIQIDFAPGRSRLNLALIDIAMVIVLLQYWQHTYFIYWLKCIFIALSIGFAIFFLYVSLDMRFKWEYMLGSIAAQKALNQKIIIVDSHPFHPLYKRYGDWGNPGKDPDVWPNTDYARYFGVEKFIVKHKSQKE